MITQRGELFVDILIDSRDQKLSLVILYSEIKVRRIEFTNALLLSIQESIPVGCVPTVP